jgi:hypothetical protein
MDRSKPILNNMQSVVLSTAYWPNLHYFYYVLNSENVLIENHEHYQKQSYRNRAQILTANGILDLSIPVVKKYDKEIINSLEISYAETWQIKHWRAISSAYKNSPYFEFFEDEIKILYGDKPQYLFEFNLRQLNIILKILRINKTIHTTSSFEEQPAATFDMREKIHPKMDFRNDPKTKDTLETRYYQTFENKFPFQANLSVLDLLFNKGLGTLDYLKEINSP